MNENDFYKLFFKAIELVSIQKITLNKIFYNINLISLYNKIHGMIIIPTDKRVIWL